MRNVRTGNHRLKSGSSRYLQTSLRPSDDGLGGAWWLPKKIGTRHTPRSVLLYYSMVGLSSGEDLKLWHVPKSTRLAKLP